MRLADTRGQSSKMVPLGSFFGCLPRGLGMFGSSRISSQPMRPVTMYCTIDHAHRARALTVGFGPPGACRVDGPRRCASGEVGLALTGIVGSAPARKGSPAIVSATVRAQRMTIPFAM